MNGEEQGWALEICGYDNNDIASSSCISHCTKPQHSTTVKEICRMLSSAGNMRPVWGGITTVIKVSCLIPLLLTPSSNGETNYCQPTRKLPTGMGWISEWALIQDFPNGSTWTLNKGCLLMKLNVETSLFWISFVNENVACFTPNGKLTGDFGLCIEPYICMSRTLRQHSVGVIVNEWRLCMNEKNTCMLTYYSVRDVNRFDFQLLFVSLILDVLFWGEP